MRIAEVYKSVQGEGRLTGVESVLVRASGCNLRCWFCDTPHASWSPEGVDLSVGEILQRVGEFDTRHVILTGGEPMLFAELVPLAAELAADGRHVTIETAGTLDLPVHSDLMSISPKLAGSGPRGRQHARWSRRHEQTRRAPAVVRRLVRDYDYQLKFVIDTLSDCELVERWLEEFPEVDRDRVWLMPQGIDATELAERSEWLAAHCRASGLVFCPRRQIEWFGFARGT